MGNYSQEYRCDHSSAERFPAMAPIAPINIAVTAQPICLYLSVGIPIASALSSSSRIAFIANPNMTVISFDMATHLSTVHSVALLQEKFPGKLVVVLGDSQKSVPDYFSNNKDAVCDVVLVDGGHEGNIPISEQEMKTRQIIKSNLLRPNN